MSHHKIVYKTFRDKMMLSTLRIRVFLKCENMVNMVEFQLCDDLDPYNVSGANRAFMLCESD